MISKQKQKYVQSLHNKKYRTQNKQFLVEGRKGIEELIDSELEVDTLYITENSSVLLPKNNFNCVVISKADLSKITTLRSNDFGLAIVNYRSKNSISPQEVNETILVLDNINDPGNLGTIIRTADWYGINHIVCSENTVEFYNPKVIMATMGSFSRTNCIYTHLPTFLNDFNLPVIGADLNGKSLHDFTFKLPCALLIGSESHGISEEVKPFVTHSLKIPQFGKAESLNAGIATAIFLDNLKRS